MQPQINQRPQATLSQNPREHNNPKTRPRCAECHSVMTILDTKKPSPAASSANPA